MTGAAPCGCAGRYTQADSRRGWPLTRSQVGNLVSSGATSAAGSSRPELAARPALQFAVLEVEHPRIPGRGGGLGRQREPLAAVIEAHVPQVSFRQSRGGEFQLRLLVEHREAAAAVLVQHVGEVAPVGTDIEVLHVPERRGGDAPVLVRDRVLQLHLRDLAVLVGEHVHAATVGGELGAPDAAGQRLRLQRRQRAGRNVGQVQVALVGGEVPPHQQLGVIGGPVERVPGVGLARRSAAAAPPPC